jgi:hypothetical protein
LKNKDKYSREDWDEIKLMYEALDNHKTLLKKKDFSGDNRKIAGLKVKFAPYVHLKQEWGKIWRNEGCKNSVVFKFKTVDSAVILNI